MGFKPCWKCKHLEGLLTPAECDMYLYKRKCDVGIQDNYTMWEPKESLSQEEIKEMREYLKERAIRKKDKIDFFNWRASE